jgi:hypothetical protein
LNKLRSQIFFSKKIVFRMDYPAGFWIALAVGGSLAGLVNFAQQYSKGESLRYNSIIRDFCIGAFLTATVYMVLPESVLSQISVGELTKVPDIELQTGPALF